MNSRVPACGLATSLRSMHDLFRGDRAEVVPTETTLLPQPHQRGPERPLAEPAPLVERAAVLRIELVEDRVGGRLIISEHDRPAVIGKPEPVEVGPAPVARLLEDRERGDDGLQVPPQQRDGLRLGIGAAADEAVRCVVLQDCGDQLLPGQPAELLDEAEDRMEEAEQGRNALRTGRLECQEARPTEVNSEVDHLLQEDVGERAVERDPGDGFHEPAQGTLDLGTVVTERDARGQRPVKEPLAGSQEDETRSRANPRHHPHPRRSRSGSPGISRPTLLAVGPSSHR